MSEDSFKGYVEDTRDCDASLLDNAVSKGLIRAKSGRPDFKKLLSLTAVCALTVVFCFSASLEPVKISAKSFLINNSSFSQSVSEELLGYYNSMTATLTEYWGGVDR